MTCNSCHQNEATIHLTEIVNNQMVEVHLCETCAQEKGTDFKTHFNFNELFAGLADVGSFFGAAQTVGVACKNCGMTLEEFGKKGRLGCADCYQSLNKALLPLIKRVQRSTFHTGKKPSKISTSVRQSVELRELQERLKKNVEREEFEEAARLRDEIRKLEEKASRKKKKNAE